MRRVGTFDLSFPGLPNSIKLQSSEHLLRTIRGSAAAYSKHPQDCFGAELIGFHDLRQLARASTVRLGRTIISRPCSEAVLLPFWDVYRLRNLNVFLFENIAHRLGATGSLLRSHETTSRASRDGVNYRYVNVHAPEFITRTMQSIYELNADAVTLAGIAYASVILMHPLSDGNGRLARAMAHCFLASDDSYCCPYLPLAPALMLYEVSMFEAHRSLGDTGNWESYLDHFRICIVFAVRLARLRLKRIATV